MNDQIRDVVRTGRASVQDGILLMELRNDMARRRRRRSFIIRLASAVGVLILAVMGIHREDIE